MAEYTAEGGELKEEEGGVTEQATSGTEGVAVPLSKNQQKKLAKRARIVEQRAERRLNRKEQRKEQRKLNGAGTADADQPPAKRQRTEEEEREWVSRQGGRGSRNREWFDEERKKGQRVVIDLSFDDIMTEREVKSLVTQVAHLYGCNRKSQRPLNLHLTSVEKRGKDGLHKISGFENWKCESASKHVSEVFNKEEIVYLTAESNTVLQKLDEKQVYVIGGIVDHNRIKGHCHELALKAGWKTAKLPLDGNVALGDHRKVLTVNHVFEILLKFQETGSWREAMGGTVPERKLKRYAQPDAKGEGEGGDDTGEGDGGITRDKTGEGDGGITQTEGSQVSSDEREEGGSCAAGGSWKEEGKEGAAKAEEAEEEVGSGEERKE